MSIGKLTASDKKELYRSVIPIAAEFRKKYLDEEQPIQDTFQTLEQLGYFIVKFPTDDQLSGFHINKSGINCVFVNSSHRLGRQHFSAWHECYHAYTGEGGGISLLSDLEYDAIEYKAESFAGCILMPEKAVRRYVRRYRIDLRFPRYEQLIRMQHYFRVSYGALLTRLTQVFPEYKDSIARRFALGSKSREADLLSQTNQFIGDDSLICPTNDFYVSPKLYENIEFNLSQGRISIEKAESILALIESIKNKYEA
ncbi:ImmA/IrrE family metallo-endopeptidase [Schinkia sp. CFF1]